MKLNPEQQRALIADFKKTVSDYYGERLAKIILYGSYARGDFHEESDIDFLVVLRDGEISAFREIDAMNDPLFELNLKFKTMISFVPTTMENFRHSKMPLYFSIRQEGREI